MSRQRRAAWTKVAQAVRGPSGHRARAARKMVAMLATLATLINLAGPVFAIVIAAPSGPEETCPNARQVTDALQLHVPGALVAPERPSLESRPDVLRTVLD